MNIYDESKPIAEINVTPLVDVSLVLVITFMVTVPMLLQPMAKVNLPVAVTALEERKDVVFLTVTPNDEIIMDRMTVPMAELLKELKTRLAKSSGKVVIIRADKEVTYKTVKKVIDTAKEAGSKKLVFATELRKNDHH